MSNNACKDWGEFSKLQELPLLEDLLFVGNPLEETHTAAGDWRKQVANRLKGLKKLDGKFLVLKNLTLMHFYNFSLQINKIKEIQSFAKKKEAAKKLKNKIGTFKCSLMEILTILRKKEYYFDIFKNNL